MGELPDGGAARQREKVSKFGGSSGNPAAQTGSSAQFSKSIRQRIFRRAEIWKAQMYFVYLKLSEPMDRRKMPGEGRSCNCAVLPKKSDEVDDAGLLDDAGDVVILVQGIQMDAVDAADAILVDELDGILDAGFLEGRLLGSDGLLGLVRGERIREDPVLGDDLAQVAGHHAAIAGERHVDGSGSVENRHDTHIDRQPDTGGADLPQLTKSQPLTLSPPI